MWKSSRDVGRREQDVADSAANLPGPDVVRLPPPIEVGLDDTVATLWRRRLEQHTSDFYAGVPISKLPEDLRVYEHLLWLAAPEVVIELGTHFGGSALWFRDRLEALAGYGRIASPRVVSVDSELGPAREILSRQHPDGTPGLTLLEGDVLDPELPERVERLIGGARRCLVVEDSAHTYETTYASLVGFSGFVPEGGFFVVEDGCVDVEKLRIRPDWPRGVLSAIEDWLQTRSGQSFQRARNLEMYGLTSNPDGYLQRGRHRVRS
jgi:cephalosporin hydroxylase